MQQEILLMGSFWQRTHLIFLGHICFHEKSFASYDSAIHSFLITVFWNVPIIIKSRKNTVQCQKSQDLMIGKRYYLHEASLKTSLKTVACVFIDRLSWNKLSFKIKVTAWTVSGICFYRRGASKFVRNRQYDQHGKEDKRIQSLEGVQT